MNDFNAEAQRRRGWEVRKAKYLWQQITAPSSSLRKIGLENIESFTGRFIESASQFEGSGIAFEKGDILYGKLRPYLAKVWIAEFAGNAVGDFFVYRLNDGINARYLHYYMRSPQFTEAANASTYGAKMPRVSADYMANLPIPLPPLPEQKEIVAYLDAETGRIDKAIAAEEKMIALLQERREIVINEAVAPHDGWEVRRLSQVILSLRTGLNPRRFFELNPDNATNYYVTIRELRNGKIVFSKDTDRINDQALSLCKNRSRLEKGDILFSGTGSIGEVALIRESPTNWNIKEGIYALKPNCKRIHTKYLVYVLVSPAFLALARARAVGTAVRSIPMKDLAILPIPLPPLPEQEAIVERLDRETGKIDRAIDVKRRQIELLRERRQIVIDEVVTGKVSCA